MTDGTTGQPQLPWFGEFGHHFDPSQVHQTADEAEAQELLAQLARERAEIGSEHDSSDSVDSDPEAQNGGEDE